MEIETVQRLRQQLAETEAKLEMLKGAASFAAVSKQDGLPKSYSSTSRTEKLAQQIIDAERRLVAMREETAIAAVDLTLEIIEKVKNNKAVTVMTLRYVSCLTFAEIAERLNYSLSYVSRLHSAGKKEFCV